MTREQPTVLEHLQIGGLDARIVAEFKARRDPPSEETVTGEPGTDPRVPEPTPVSIVGYRKGRRLRRYPCQCPVCTGPSEAA